MVSLKSMVFNTMTHRLMLCYYKKAKKRSFRLIWGLIVRANPCYIAASIQKSFTAVDASMGPLAEDMYVLQQV